MLTGENQTAQTGYADLVLLVDIFLCNSRASNTCLTIFQNFKKSVFPVMTSVFETKALKSLDFTGIIVYSMARKATAKDVLLRLKNKWGSRGRWFESSHSDQNRDSPKGLPRYFILWQISHRFLGFQFYRLVGLCEKCWNHKERHRNGEHRHCEIYGGALP